MLHDAIARDAEEERRHRAALRVIFFRLAHQSHEHVLHNLLGGPGASGHAQRKAKKGRLVPPVKRGKSVLVALTGATQQNVVCDSVFGRHLSRFGRSTGCHLTFPWKAGKSSRATHLPSISFASNGLDGWSAGHVASGNWRN